MMINIVSEHLSEEINTVSASQMLRISHRDKEIQLIFFLSRLFQEAEGCAG